MSFPKNTNQGFTILYAGLVAALLTAFAVSIGSILISETRISSLSRDSEFAYYAAETGIECAIYWDVNADAFNPNSGSNISCNANDENPENDNIAVGGSSESQFTVTFEPDPYCAEVTVSKNDGETTVQSRGYNRCNPGRRVQRGLETSYVLPDESEEDSGGPQENGLVAHWTFDSEDIDFGSNTAYDIAYINHGDMVGLNSGNLVSGQIGQALEFTGSEYITVSDNPDLDMAGDYSIAGWMRSSMPNGFYEIVSKIQPGSSSMYQFFGQNNQDSLATTIRYNGNDYVRSVNRDVTTGDWKHVAMVRSGGNVDFYVDGVHIWGRRLSVPEGDLSNDADLEISGNGYVGTLDDIRIYNRALTLSEIQDLATQ